MQTALMGTRIRRAARRGELELHYQPIVALESGTAVAAEALVRWRHPRLGLLPPAAFVPHVDGGRHGQALNRFVIGTAIEQAGTWARAGRPLQVAVNLSPRWLRPELADLVEASLERWELPPHLLHVELTELRDPDGTIERTAGTLARLQMLGISISLDDFGRGESSLARLATLPVDILKVDRSFVSGIDVDRRTAGLVQHSIQLAHSFEMKAIAEGVETERQWDRLRGWGCDLAQGFLLSRPVPAQELNDWLEGQAMPLMWRLTRNPRPFVERRVGLSDRRRFGERRRERRPAHV